jgi:hypothetical protein
MLQGVVKPLNMTIFNGQEWVFQQDSVRAHKAKTTEEWLRRNLLAFIRAENWPSGSPDLNPLNCKLWAVLKDMACQKNHNNMESLKKSFVKAAAERDSPGDSACGDSRVAGASQGLRQGRERPF